MGEGKKVFFEPSFNRAVKVRGGQDRLTSDAGTLLLREADHRLGLTQSLAGQLYDRRHPDHIRYTLVELLRERLYAMAQGYDAQDDVDELAHDPAMRLATWDRPGKRVQEERLASQPTQSRLLTALGNYKPNTERLRETLADWSGRHLRATGNDHTARRITIDIDSLPIQAYGSQAGVKYNGYYHEEVFHPLVASYPQRVILVIVDCPDPKTGQLFLEPDSFFLVTSYSAQQRPAEERLEHYRQRGTFEDRLGEFRQWIGPKLSSQEFESNEATLLLSLLAFNLANMLRCELEDGAGACWDLGRFQKSVLKAGGRIVKKAGRVIVDLAAAVVPLWERLVARLGQWRLPKRFPLPLRPAYRPFLPPPRHAFLTRVIRE